MTSKRTLEGEPRGKTEAWVILHAEPGAQLVIGLRMGTSREMMAEAIQRNRLEALLVYAEVKTGDVLYIPANTIHALGPGILIYEIQQASDVTYRLYDWGRLGLDGQPRELHIDKGVQVANLESLPHVRYSPRTSCSSMANTSAFGVMNSLARPLTSKPMAAFNR